MNTKRLSLYTMVIALYAVSTLMLGSFSFGPIQIRVSEVLLLFVLFRKDFIAPLTLACFVTNLIGVLMGINIFGIFDIVFGTLASFLALYFAYVFKNVLYKGKPLVSFLMPVLFNGLIVGLELAIVLYPKELWLEGFLISAAQVAFGEFIAVFVLGIFLYEPFKKFMSSLKD